jgi:hypothetical protein
VSFLADRYLASLERLIVASASPPSHKRVERVVALHLNDVGLAWPSIERIQLVLLNEGLRLDGPRRGHTAPGTSAATIKRALASSTVFATVGRIATNRQPGGGWFAHGSLRALTDQVRDEIRLGVTLADALTWAAAAGVVAPLGELAPRRFRSLNEP